jgi:metacaspase-1
VERIQGRVLRAVPAFVLTTAAAFAALLPDSSYAATKRALIVAIGQYSPSTGWQPLSSERDDALIEKTLIAHGFAARNIKHLRGTDAKRDEILSAIRRELVSPSEAGDVAVLHFSGHGQQITDDDGDELDGYDEALVPYDAPQRPPPGYGGEKHLRDDDLGSVLRELRARVGPRGDVLVLLDSCHSGTAARAADSPYPHAVRGARTPIGPPQSRDGEAEDEDASGFLDARAGAAQNLAPLVVLSAEKHNRLAEETVDESGKNIGALSWAVSAALATADTQTSYRDLYETVRLRTASRQIPNAPQAEGNLDRMLFGGLAVAQESFRRVTKLVAADRVAELEGGTLVGLGPGAVIEIHRAGTRTPTPETLIAKGIVKSATEFRAQITLTDIVDRRARDGWAFVTQQVFGSLRVHVFIDASAEGAWATPVRAALERAASAANSFIVPLAAKPAGLVESDSTAIVLIRDGLSETPPGNGVLLETWESGQTLGDAIDPADPDLAAMIVERLHSFAQNSYLRRLDVKAPNLGAEIELFPCRLECSATDACGGEACSCVVEGRPEELRAAGNEIRLLHGQGFGIRLRNTGTREAYATVLDLMPDGAIGLVWPLPDTPVADTAIARGATYKVVDPNSDGAALAFRACPPYGTDVLKVITTTEPVDFGPITSFGARARGGESGPLDRLFRENLTGARGATPAFSSGSVSTSAVTITIEPAGD